MRIVDKNGICAMDEDDLGDSCDPLVQCDIEWPDYAPHHWDPPLPEGFVLCRCAHERRPECPPPDPKEIKND